MNSLVRGVDLIDLMEAPTRPPRGVPADVAELFERLSLEVIGRGFRRYSSRAVLHRLRWHAEIEQGRRGFKVNNHWSRPLADWFIARHPEHQEFFERRDRRDDGGDDGG